MGRAVAPGGVAAAEAGIEVAIMGHFQTGFSKESGRINMAQQLDYKRTSAGSALGVVAGLSGPAKAGHGASSGNAGAASDAGVLAAATSVDDGPDAGWRSIRARSAPLGTACASAWRCPAAQRRQPNALGTGHVALPGSGRYLTDAPGLKGRRVFFCGW